ncbi:MAG TPA: glycoside hydrolase family 5 protein [Polyangiaceae bacterium]
MPHGRSTRSGWLGACALALLAACGTPSPTTSPTPPDSETDAAQPPSTDDASTGITPPPDSGSPPPPTTDAAPADAASDGPTTVADAGPPPTAAQAILQMQRGLNIGNSLDAPGGETSWGNPVIQDYYFDDLKAAGFTAVRIPVTWDQHVGQTAPYAIDATFLTRVEQVLDWALSRGLYVLVNAHHESWLKTSTTPANIARFAAIWTQLSTRFMSKSDHLVFEILNEPNPMGQSDLDALNVQILGIMRQTNPTRLVVYAGTNYSGSAELEQAKVPAAADPYLIANYHSYNPWSFVSGDQTVIWGSQSDKNAVGQEFDAVAQFAASHHLALMLNEFGAGPNHDYNSRVAFFQTYVADALSHGMAFFAWDDNGGFQTYVRQDPGSHVGGGQWNDDNIRNILTK